MECGNCQHERIGDGFPADACLALYFATRHTVAGCSEALDHELRTSGTHVSVVAPTCTNTSFDASLMKPDAPLDLYRDMCVRVEGRGKEVPVGADGPDVAAEVVVKVALATRARTRYAPRARWAHAPADVLDACVRKALRLLS